MLDIAALVLPEKNQDLHVVIEGGERYEGRGRGLLQECARRLTVVRADHLELFAQG